MAKTIKEIIIMLLICLVTMLILAIALYQYIPNRKVVPEITKYAVTEEVQDLLEDNIDTRDDDDNVILTYEVTSSDLSNYQSVNSYVPGKSNPFAEYSHSTTGEGSTESNNTTQKDGQESSNQSSTNSTTPNVYQNNGSK